MTLSTDLFLEYKSRPGRPALARLLERHQDSVYTLCLNVLHHPQDAEDACQDVLLEMARQVDSIRDKEAFSGWLYRTALHTALDLKRKRGRRRIREAHSRGRPESKETQEQTEALFQGLAGLDDPSRRLMIEHYLEKRPLREMAAQQGCSEVAVWKRLQAARERLRKEIGSQALFLLDAAVRVRAPGGLVQKACALKGGMAMSIPGALIFTVGVPLVFLAGAGLVVSYRLSETRPSDGGAKPASVAAVPAARPAAGESPQATESKPSRPAQADPGPRSAPRARKPYPFPAKPSGIPHAALLAWEELSTRRVTLDVQNEPLPAVLGLISKQTGLLFTLDGRGHESEFVSFKVQAILADGCLQLLLGPRNSSFEIQADGRIHIGKRENIQGGFEREARGLARPLQELGYVREMLDGGWDGVRNPTDPSERLASLRAKKIVLPQGESSLEAEFRRLGEHDQIIADVDVPIPDVQALDAFRAMMKKPFLQPVRELSVGEHLEDLAKRFGLTLTFQGSHFRLTTPEKAAQYNSQVESQNHAYQESLKCLDRKLPETGPVVLQDLFGLIHDYLGLEVIPSREAWESEALVSLPPEATLRQGLDRLRKAGFRWAVQEGKVFVLK
jgi:RNA polymerase sigma-70 factor (ECF subfamily)